MIDLDHACAGQRQFRKPGSAAAGVAMDERNWKLPTMSVGRFTGSGKRLTEDTMARLLSASSTSDKSHLPAVHDHLPDDSAVSAATLKIHRLADTITSTTGSATTNSGKRDSILSRQDQDTTVTGTHADDGPSRTEISKSMAGAG